MSNKQIKGFSSTFLGDGVSLDITVDFYEAISASTISPKTPSGVETLQVIYGSNAATVTYTRNGPILYIIMDSIPPHTNNNITVSVTFSF